METPVALRAEYLSVWKHFVTTDNSPNIPVIPRKQEYVRTLFWEWCYMLPTRQAEV